MTAALLAVVTVVYVGLALILIDYVSESDLEAITSEGSENSYEDLFEPLTEPTDEPGLSAEADNPDEPGIAAESASACL